MPLQNHLKPRNTEVSQLAVAENSVSVFQGNDGDVVVEHHRVRRFNKPGQAAYYGNLVSWGLGNYNSLPFIDVSIKVQPIHLECVVILSY